MTVCGTSFCVGGRSWYMYGASEYQATRLIGIDYPAATIALARQGGLNTIRIINFYNKGDAAVTPYDPATWAKVDMMIADAHAAGMHVDLGLADYRRILWYNCINPYTYDWGQFISFVANRRNTVTGAIYKYDPTISFISLAGEPLPVGVHTYLGQNGQTCTVTYSGQDLLNFYTRTLGQWHAQGPTVLGNTGGLGYINEANGAGIPWQSIFALSTDAFCDIKTYGGMYAYAPTVAAYCHSIGKPIMDEEFGWQQSMGDAQRAAALHATRVMLHANGFAGQAFWNLNEQISPTGYDIGPMTPLTWATLIADNPGY
jgi:mannan endo-1,4-beta-mannosidase